MKYIQKTMMLFLLLVVFGKVNAQVDSLNKISLAVLSMDTKDVPMTAEAAGNMLRIEMEKLNQYEILDRYDVKYVTQKKQLDITNCYGKLCLVEIGKELDVTKMLSGTIEKINGTIYISLRLIDIPSNKIEKTHIREFRDIPYQLQNMTSIVLREMFGLPNDETLENSLTVKHTQENAINTPYANRLNLNGPRMGFTVLTGDYANIFSKPLNEGGYEAVPVMFQFGYQLEARYLNEGNIQALFEFIPMITGLDQGLFIPSLTIMHGLRNNKNGWEFAFGPTLNFVHKAKGYYDADGVWNLESNWTDTLSPNPYSLTTRIDSRGELDFTSGFIIAVGKTFRSGKLNIPVNAYIIPNNKGMRFGLSFGFNAKK